VSGVSMAEAIGGKTDDIRLDVNGEAASAASNNATLSRCIPQWSFLSQFDRCMHIDLVHCNVVMQANSLMQLSL
jgi:hypothetical protein